MMKGSFSIILILIVAAALRIPGIFWGEIDRSNGIVLEPDEFQHIALAADYVHQWGGENGQALPYRFWNTRAYGFQLGTLLYIGGKLGFDLNYHTKHALVGRFLSTFYGVLLVLLLYFFALFLFDSHVMALMAATLMAIFDLHITYSHYALPAAAYLFWAHATVFALIRLYYHESGLKPSRRAPGWRLFSVFGIAMTFGLKFDFLVLGMALLMAVLLVIQSKNTWSKATLNGIGLIAGSSFFFFLIHGFSFNWDDFKYSFQVAQGFNQNAIQEDNHWVHNPILYVMALIGGTSIWVFLSMVLGIIFFMRGRKKWLYQWPGFLLFLCFIGLEFGVRWYLDTPFIRRANIFLPFCALMSAWFCWQLWERKKGLGKLVIPVIGLYTLGLSITSQYNFWQDTRYKALAFLHEHPLEGKVYYSTYAKIPGMPEKTVDDPEAADFLIIHETFYSRYWKFFTTPFKRPSCCREVYNCGSETICQYYQKLLANQTDFTQLASFETISLFPERVWFKSWFGTYETFVGDLKIYKRQK